MDNKMKAVITNPILLTLIEKGFELVFRKDGILVDGFYKSGHVRLVPQEDGTFVAHSRYDQTNSITSFEDLVNLNYEWWQFSKNRSEGWINPTEQWGKEMVKLGLVKRKEKTVIRFVNW